MHFDDSTIRSLLDLSWWDWPIEQIQNSYKYLLDCNLEALWAIKNNALR